MKRIAPFVVLVAVASAGVLTPGVMDALTTIDSPPSSSELASAFMGSDFDVQKGLIQIALFGSDDGVRIRAIHELGHYCSAFATPPQCTAGDLAHQALAQLLANYSAARSGSPVLLLRAALEAIGPMRVATDEPTLEPLLDHPSRDIRASTAHALRDLCDPAAIPALRARLGIEKLEQVQLAISEALRVLPLCP